MGVRQEADAILTRAKQAIASALNNEIAQIAKDNIQFRVESNVYPEYSPTMYERRMREGGLADTNLYQASVDEGSLTLTVRDDRHEVGVVESGEGYTWEDSDIYDMQPFPRPYFQDAENDVVLDGEAEAVLINKMLGI